MGVSVVPALIDALIDYASGVVTTAEVLDGFGLTDDPGDYLMVGVEDPDSDAYAYSAETRQEWAHANHTTRDEAGDITCAALSWNGDADQKAARDAVYQIAAEVEDMLRANYTLGVEGVLWTGFGSTTSLMQSQDTSGAVALLTFRIAFRARI